MDKELYQLCVNYGLRALLGDSKGKTIVDNLEKEDPETYQLITAEASSLYDNLNIEQRLDPIETLVPLMEEGIKLQFEILRKRLEQNIS